MRIARFSRERWGIKSKERVEREREMMSLMEPSCAAMIWCWSFFDSASWVWKSVRPHRSAYERQKGRKYKMKKQMSAERLEHSRRSWQCRASTLLLLRCDNETLSLSCFTFRTLELIRDGEADAGSLTSDHSRRSPRLNLNVLFLFFQLLCLRAEKLYSIQWFSTCQESKVVPKLCFFFVVILE